MKLGRIAAMAVIMTHLLLNIWHGIAHLVIPVSITQWQLAYVAVVIYLAPLWTLFLIARQRLMSGGVWLLISMIGSLMFEWLNHYVLDGADHVHVVPDHAWRDDFVFTAYWLNVTDMLGIALAVTLLALCSDKAHAIRGLGNTRINGRFEPIVQPENWFLKVAYFYSKRQFGRVISPISQVYSRKPILMSVATLGEHILHRRLSLQPELILLIQAFTAYKNGCAFCEDITLAKAIAQGIGREKFAAIATYPDANMLSEKQVFSEKEKAVLDFVNEYHEHRHVRESTLSLMEQYFNEQQMIEVAWVNALEQYYNALNKPLGITSDHLAALLSGDTVYTS